MSVPPIPLINGNRYEWASIQFTPAGFPLIGVKSIDYSQEKKGGEVFGTSVVKIGETRGQLKPEASMELFKEEADAFIDQLSVLGAGNGPGGGKLGYMDVRFPITVQYQEQQNGQLAIVTDTLVGCRISKHADSHSEGTDGLTVKFDLSLFWITPDGNPPVAEASVPL